MHVIPLPGGVFIHCPLCRNDSVVDPQAAISTEGFG